MGAGLIIRPLRADEADAAQVMLEVIFDRYLALVGLSTESNPNPYADNLNEAIADGRAWAAEVAGELAGVAQVDAKGDVWALELVGVLEAHAGAGIGRALMERAEADARARGVAKIALSTLEIADHLWRFYERLGYVIVRRGPPAHGLDEHTRVFMELTLK